MSAEKLQSFVLHGQTVQQSVKAKEQIVAFYGEKNKKSELMLMRRATASAV